MSEKRFRITTNPKSKAVAFDEKEKKHYIGIDLEDLLNEQDEKIQRWKNLYELKGAEVTARVDGLNKVCNYYLNEVLFKSDTDPNKAVKEVINRILNTEVKNDE